MTGQSFKELVLGQEFVQPGLGDVRDAGEGVGEPCLWIDIVELGRTDEGVEAGSAFAAPVGAEEQPGFAAKSNSSESTLGGVVGPTNPAVVEESGEGRPAYP